MAMGIAGTADWYSGKKLGTETRHGWIRRVVQCANFAQKDDEVTKDKGIHAIRTALLLH